MSSTIYKPLATDTREIRLLHLQAGAWSEPIACLFSTISLDTKPRYRALSYVWGNSTITYTIYIQNESFPVTVNLAAALRRLRHEHDEVILWADAVCINQQDVIERNNQVRMMSAIYSNTEEAVVWLGEGDDATYLTTFDASATAIQTVHFGDLADMRIDGLVQKLDARLTLNQTTRSSEAIKQRLNVEAAFNFLCEFSRASCWCECSTIQRAREKASTLIKLDDEYLKVIASVSQRAWWRRVWTVQEIILPPKAVAYYDFASFSWRVFQDLGKRWPAYRFTCAVCQSETVDKPLEAALGTLTRRIQDIEGSRWLKGRFNLFDTYVQFRTRKATDPRDMVYALAGGLCSSPLKAIPDSVTKSVLPHPVDIDYRLHHREVFKQMAWIWICASKTLDLLIFTGEPDRDEQLPSWVPDWTANPLPEGARTWEPRIPRLQKFFRASGEYPAVAEWDRSTCLSVRGIYLDVLLSSSVPKANPSSPNSEKYPAGGSKVDALWRTLNLDTIQVSSGRRRTIPADRELFLAWYKDANAPGEAFDPVLVPQDYRNAFRINALAGDCNKLFVTQKCYLGCSVLPLHEGDEIWVLYGCRMPTVLRPDTKTGRRMRLVDNGASKHHTVVGPCYLHGFMDGEALGEPGLTKHTVHLN